MPHPAVFHQTLKTRVSQMLRSSYVAFFQLPLIPERLSRAFDFAVLARSMRKTANEGTFSSQDMEIYKKAWRHPGALTAMLNWYRAYKYNRLSTSGTLAMPVLLIWGTKDQFLIPQMAQPSVERCTSGKLVMMDDATHWIHHEHPVRVNTLIYEFVTKQNTNS
jgi:pimeloyl-ACP methyl ester carboxylesterase